MSLALRRPDARRQILGDSGSDDSADSDGEARRLEKEAVTEITNYRGGESQRLQQSPKNVPVIPAMVNSSRVYHSTRTANNTATILSLTNDEVIKLADEAFKTDIETKYGLVVKASKRQRVEAERERQRRQSTLLNGMFMSSTHIVYSQNSGVDHTNQQPLLITNDISKNDRLSEVSDIITPILTDKELFDRDMAVLPDMCTMDTYDALPIEDFGAALLRGLGWKEGQAVGRSTKHAMIKPIEYIPRPALLGIGAQPLPEQEELPTLHGKHKVKRQGQTEKNLHNYELPTREDGTVRHYRTVDEQLKSRRKLKFEEKCFVLITHGRHEGLEGQVVELRQDKGTARVKLSESGTMVHIDTRDVKVIDTSRNSSNYGGYNSSARTNSNSSISSPRGESYSQRKFDVDVTNDTSTKDKRKMMDPPVTTMPRHELWLLPNLRVRIVRSFNGGRHYNKKAHVIDVLPDGFANLKLEEDDQYIERVDQQSLETLVGRPGDEVVIVRLSASSRQQAVSLGVKATIMEKDKRREKVLLQLEDDSILELGFDDVCSVV